MRRLIDSLILALIAYTVIVPLARGLTQAAQPEEKAEPETSTHWSVVGENIAGAELQLRLDSGDGATQDFAIVCDEDGCFELPLVEPPPPSARLMVFDGAGAELTKVEVSAESDSKVLDLGALR